MPFPLQVQSAARATGSGGGRAGDVGRVGQGEAENSGRGPASSRETVDSRSRVASFETLLEGWGCSLGYLEPVIDPPSSESSYPNKSEIGLPGGVNRPEPLSLCRAGLGPALLRAERVQSRADSGPTPEGRGPGRTSVSGEERRRFPGQWERKAGVREGETSVWRMSEKLQAWFPRT